MVIGAGPNGLSAAVALAQKGVGVLVLEAAETIGGGARTAEILLPGFRQDLGSSVYPMAASSPFFESLPLDRFGLRWVEPEAPLAHPLADGTAVMLEHSMERTAEGLGAEDGRAWTNLLRPMVEAWPDLISEVLGPIVHLPKHALPLAKFGMYAAMPATALGKMVFRGDRARALLAGLAGHGVMPLDALASSAVGLVLAAAGHAKGWPVAEGGGQSLSDALAGYLRSMGGEIRTGVRVERVERVGGGRLRVSAEGFEAEADAVMGDVSPRALVGMAGGEMQDGNRRLMSRFRYGPGIFKVDWALREPIPWRAKDCLRAGTVHVGGSSEEIAASERGVWNAEVVDRPYLIVTQPSLFDRTRAPEGGHTAWAYCHVPNGWTGDGTELIESQMERFAPGFRECVLARRSWGAESLEGWDENLIGGDITGGAMTPWQMAMRPTPRLWETSVPGLFLCSSSTPPGGGVHGMCGFLASQMALKWMGR